VAGLLAVWLPAPGQGASLQTQVLPPAWAETEDTAGQAGTLGLVTRMHDVYEARLFPQFPIVIREVRFRRDAQPMMQPPIVTSISDIQLLLTTTTKGADMLSATFANNLGADATVVFRGSVAVASTNNALPGAPNAFDISIPLTTPFRYDPARGNPLIEIRNFSGSSLGAIDATPRGDDGASRAFSYMVPNAANATQATYVDTGADIVQLVYEPQARALVISPTGGEFINSVEVTMESGVEGE
jgi:hypothetical protein